MSFRSRRYGQTRVRVPGRGQATVRRVLTVLAEAQARATRPLGELIAEQSRQASPGLTVLVVTSGVEPGLQGALLAAASRGVVIRCLLLAPEAELTEARESWIRHA